MTQKFKLICIDKNKCSIILEVDERIYNILGIEKELVKKHKSRRQLLLELNDFLDKNT